MSAGIALDGFVAPSDPLSPRTAFAGLNPVSRRIVGYDPKTLWERDTARLPRSLASLRERAREFADLVLVPVSLELDVTPQPPLTQWNPLLRQAIVAAGREGFMTDMVLPRPFGTAIVSAGHHPVWALAVKVEEFARGCGGLMLSLMVPALGQCPLLFSGDPMAIRRFILPAFREIKSGEPHPFSFAITEPTAGSDVEEGHGAEQYEPGMVASRVPGGWRLNGRKRFIGGGDLSKTICVFAALEGEGMASWTCFVVQPPTPGFTPLRKEHKMGMRASGTAEFELDNVFVPEANVVGGLRQGWALNRATLNVSRIPVAAMGVGFARAAMEAALEFACSTTLAGKPLVNYQEVQLQLADMVAETAAIRGMVWDQARTFIPTQAAASMTKLYCTDRALNVCNTAMDLIGNHSLLHANRAEKAFRDARLPIIFEGTNQINRLAVIEDIQEEVLAKCRP
ncbi:acyl-CoA dehydrogenase family protein [Antrihabitans stalactiti]|uniref:Acyl-CoA dehydrogenase n=1 Tax=Antrihabitans stalactiti TaxID=2584121 RepID=A0A848K8Y9_9NOCA|nr:acyl-CoA dehydrogenase family protein [Antrihabitans stalactiti]NMN93754.1 acyl-CoA dehydrogenase [Antrihabitans stalactiti]